MYACIASDLSETICQMQPSSLQEQLRQPSEMHLYHEARACSELEKDCIGKRTLGASTALPELTFD